MKRLELEEIRSRKGPLIIATGFSVGWSLFFFNVYSAMFLTLSAVVWIYYYLSKLILKNLTIDRSVDRERLFPGETLTLVHNIRRVPFISLSLTVIPVIRAEREYAAPRESSISLSSTEDSRVESKVVFRRRGEKDLSRLIVACRDPLGLFSHSATYYTPQSVLVLPKVMDLETFPLRLRELLPGRESDFRLMEDPIDFKGIKEYERESLNRIHWNASAKLGKLMSKEFGYTAVSKTVLYLDLNLSREVFARDVWERIRIDYEEIAVQLALGLIRLSYRSGGSIRLVSVGEEVLRLSDRGRDWIDFAEALSNTKGIDHGSQLCEIIEDDLEQFDPSTTVVLISLYLGEEILPQLLRARSHASRVVVLIIPFSPREPWMKRNVSYQMLPKTIDELKKRAAFLEEEQIIVRVVGDDQSIQEVLLDL